MTSNQHIFLQKQVPMNASNLLIVDLVEIEQKWASNRSKIQKKSYVFKTKKNIISNSMRNALIKGLSGLAALDLRECRESTVHQSTKNNNGSFNVIATAVSRKCPGTLKQMQATYQINPLLQCTKNTQEPHLMKMIITKTSGKGGTVIEKLVAG